MNKQIDDRIKKAKLTDTEQKVAEYISLNHNNIFALSALKLGRLIGTSDTSVIRTARKLGFSGYAEMQQFLANPIYDEIARNEGINFLSPRDKVDRKISQLQQDNLYERVLKTVNDNICDIMTKNSAADFEKAGRLIAGAKRKFVVGYHGCAGVAQLLGGCLCDVFRDVTTVTGADSVSIEAMLDIEEGDCVIIVSFPRYSEMAQAIHSYAIEKKAHVIALTDRITSPVSRGSAVSLLCRVDSVTINNSYVAPTVVAEMLTAAIYRNIGDEEEERLAELEKYISRHGLY